MEPTSSFYSSLPLILFEDIQKNRGGIDFLCRQLCLKPVGSIPEEALKFQPGKVEVINTKELFGRLTTLEVHALFISIKGWKPFREKIEAKKSIEDIETTYKGINELIPELSGDMINIMRWLEIRLPYLLLKHKKAVNIKVRVITTEFKEKEVLKADLAEIILTDLNLLFNAFQEYLNLNDEKILTNQLKNDIFINDSYWEFTKTTLTSEAHNEMVNLIKIIKNCLTYPKELFPLLLTTRPRIEIFPDFQSSFLSELHYIDNYYGEKIPNNIPQKLRKSFLLTLHEIKEILIEINKDIENLNSIIKNRTFLKLTEVKSLNSLTKLSKNNDNYINWVHKYENCPHATGSETEEMCEIIKKYHLYLYNHYYMVASTILNSSETVCVVIKCAKDLGIELNNFHSGIFSLGDIILIKLHEQARKIFKCIGTDDRIIRHLIEGILSINIIDIDLSKLSYNEKSKSLSNYYRIVSDLEFKTKLLRQVLQKYPNLKTVTEDFVKYLDISIQIFKHFYVGIDLLGLLWSPIKESSPIPSSAELDFLQKKLKILSEELFEFFDEKSISFLGKRFAPFNIFIVNWKERFQAQLKKVGLPLENKIQNYISSVEEVIDFFTNLVNDKRALFINEHLGSIINILKNTYIETAKPLLTFAMRQELLSSTPKKGGANQRKKRGQKPNAQKPLVKTPPLPKPMRQLFIPWKMLNLNPSSSPEIAIQKEAHEQEVKKSYLEFQQNWKDLPFWERLQSLHSLCKRLQTYEFQMVHYGSLKEGENQFESIKNEAKSNLQSSVEDLLTLAEQIESEKITPHQFSFLVLRMSIAIEQAIKLLFNRKNSITHVHKHQPGLLYQELVKNQEQIQFPLPLSTDQTDWLNSLDSIIDISGRYTSKSFDFMVIGNSQILYLSTLELDSLSKEEQNQARFELCQGLGIPFSEQESLPSLIQKGWKYVQENRRQFFETGLEVLKNLLLSVDVENMSVVPSEKLSFKADLSLLSGIFKDLQIQTKSSQMSNLITQMDMIWNKLYNGQNLHRLHSPHFKSTEIKTGISSALKESEGALQSLKNLFPYLKGSSAYAWGMAALLKEAVLIESMMQALMGYLPLFDEGESSSHLLFTDFHGKPFCHSHQLQKFLDKIKPHIKELPATVIDHLEDRIKILEPILKKLYRYNSDALSESQQLLNQLRFLDQLNFSLSKGTLRPDQKEELESITKGFSIDLANLDVTIEEFIEGKIIRSLPSTLKAVDKLLDILLIKIKQN